MAISALLRTKLDQLKRELDKVPVMHKMEQTVKVPKEYIVTGVSVVLLLCLTMGYGAAFICNLVGFLYPTYQSFRAIESTSKKDTTQWLTYWLVFSALSIPEAFPTLLSWIPFYYLAKVALLLWCFLPQTEGASFIYEKVLKGMLVKSEAKIDAVLKKSASGTPVDPTAPPATPASGNGGSSSTSAAPYYPKID